MKKLTAVFSFIFCVVFLMACDQNNFSSPKGIIETAGFHMQQNNFKKFKKTLKDSAKKEFGTETGMQTLQNYLKDLDTKVDEPVLIDTQYKDVIRLKDKTYLVNILGKTKGQNEDPYKVVVGTQVVCEYSYTYYGGGWGGGGNYGGLPGPGHPNDCWGVNPPPYCHQYEAIITYCLISDIKLL
ncbi:MAG: hypothetical protein HY843_01710 [Bdellovibrio sp.]|nr:hypothetical protein [Bdellovibrio sp.]